MKKSRSRWYVVAGRWGLCLVALVFLVNVVSWYDYVVIEETGEQVRLIEEQGDQFLIARDGTQELIPRTAVRHVTAGDREVPDIERGIASVMATIEVPLALLAILIFLPVILLQSYRLVVMVGIQAVRISYWNAVKLTFAGNFFNFTLPGTTGGDLVKAYFITRHTHRKTEVVTTIFLDRAIGLFGILLLAVGAMLIRWDPSRFGQLVIPLIVVFAGLAVGAVVVFSSRVRHALRLPELAERLPLGEQLLRIGRATVAMREHKFRVAVAMLLTFLLQSIVMISAAVMAWSLGMQGTLLDFFVYVSIGFLIAAIPITPQGLGVMETAYVVFFTQSGLNNDPSQAVALSLAVRLTQLLWAIPGVLVPLLGAHLPTQAELEGLEAQAAAEANAETSSRSTVDETVQPAPASPDASAGAP